MNTFETLGIDGKILSAIKDMGFENPMPIQEKAIPELLKNDSDYICLAQTGTGKTAAFGLPLAQLIDFKSPKAQAIVLCPTRELCMQITGDITNFTKNISGANIVAVYGGASIEGQVNQIRRGAQIIVATPGRMVDIINRKKVDLSEIKWSVLDEADEMLNMGFKEDLDTILSKTSAEKHTWLFSATMAQGVADIARNYMRNAKEISVGKKNQGADNISHIYYVVHARDKYLALKRIADYNPDIYGIIFCRTKIETQMVADHLIKDGYSADCIHGDLSQAQRDSVMKKYRSKTIQMLVATDVAARGIDVDDVTHVINYSLPDEAENYTHRSGRTARAGKSGVSIVIINMKEIGKIRFIERIIGKKFTEAKIPAGKDICEKQLFSLIDKSINTPVNEKEIEPYLPKIFGQLEHLSKEDIIKRLISTEFNRFLEYYKNSNDLAGDRSHSASHTDGTFKRMFISLGRLDGVDKGQLLNILCTGAELTSTSIGRIDLMNSYSFFEVDKKDLEKLKTAFAEHDFKGRKIKIEESEKPVDAKRERYGDRDSRGGGEKREFRKFGGDRGGYGGKRDGGGRGSYGGGGDRKSSGGSDRGGDRGGFSGGGESREGGAGSRRDKFAKGSRPRKKF